jgi:cobalt-zinc-cadmium efflux system protein
MKTERKIFIAFLLNLFFSIFELIGGLLTGSVSIMSDALHDFGDASSIGLSYFLERKSLSSPNAQYTYGYRRYSVLGAFITSVILLFGSVAIILNSLSRFFNPVQIDYNGMIIFAVFGTLINVAAAVFTHHGNSINQKAINLHMIEDALGWIVVRIGSILIKFTGFWLIDPIMSIGVALFIIFNALMSLNDVLCLFLEKTPRDISIDDIKTHLLEIDGVIDVHHIHIWSMDGQNNYATMHVVTDKDHSHIKQKVKRELLAHNVFHTTVEIESSDEECTEKTCIIDQTIINNRGHSHNHSHHHHH